MADLAQIAAVFGEVLHSAGLPASPERRARFARGVVLVRPRTIDQVYWIGRATLVSSREQIDVFDNVFNQVFTGVVDMRQAEAPGAPQPTQKARESGENIPGDQPPSDSGAPGRPGDPQGGADEEAEQSQDNPTPMPTSSQEERLKDQDFATLSQEELDLLTALVAKLPLVPPRRPSRRTRRHPHGTIVDMRATVRGALRTGGETARIVQRARRDRPRRVVLLADVSGSMEPYSRVYLHLMLGAVRALHAEAFVFATRLTRLTRFLAYGKPDLAYRKVAEHTPDWSGGTRIGDALMSFLREHGQRGVARGAVVVIVSDGWEVGDPHVVTTAMRRLSHLAHTVIWVNPRKAAPGYQPLVGGMAAALPYVDTFVSGHSYRTLVEVMDAISAAVRRPSVTHPAVPARPAA